MAIPLILDGAFPNEQALRGTVAARKVCFDHDPFYVMDGRDRMIRIGFQLNLYAAFKDPRHLPLGEDAEHRELVGDLMKLCRVFFQSLDLLKPCNDPERPAPRVLYSPERGGRAEVCLQVPIFDRERFGAKPDRRLAELLATAECLLRSVGARAGKWDDDRASAPREPSACEDHAAAAQAGPDAS